MVPHTHSDDVKEYRYIDMDGQPEFKAHLCSRCIKFDRSKGYILERVFQEGE